MNKIQEELSTSAIFVVKWLLLGLGALWILYFAIGVAYDKSYFEPRMRAFDFKISESTSAIEADNDIKANFEQRLDVVNERQAEIQALEIPDIEAQIESAKSAAKNMGTSCWLSNIPTPGFTKDPAKVEACNQLDSAINDKVSLEDELEDLVDSAEDFRDDIIDISKVIDKKELKLAKLMRDKEAAKADMKGVLMWAAALLGLSF
jgi:hypothetical protein